MSATDEQPTTDELRPRPAVRLGLSGKLLLLTIPLVMIAGMLIYVPAIANFRINRLNDRLAAATTAALVMDAAPSGYVPEKLARQILSSIDARAVAIKLGQQRRLLASTDLPATIDHDIDMRTVTVWSAIVDALEMMLDTGDQTMRVVGSAPGQAQFIEVVIDEKPLRQAMYRFSRNLLIVALLIAGLTAFLVYLALHYLFVRPMRRLTASLVGFHENPESPARIIVPSQRGDEIGVAERELSDMQRDLVSMLHQKSRLAALGLAVSKINHDLRNMLSTARLLSDRLARSSDERTRSLAPTILGTIDRAARLASDAIEYVRDRPTPRLARIDLVDLIDEVGVVLQEQGEDRDPNLLRTWINEIRGDRTILADRDLLYRVFLNLGRNAFEAGATSVAGVGSTFWFTAWLGMGRPVEATLPLPVDAGSAEDILRREFTGMHVLLVEDEPINQEVAKLFLGDVGLDVAVAGNGVVAVDMLREGDFALILMDMQMPEMDGLEATRQIRRLPGRERVPIVAMTANAFAEDRIQCLAAGMDDFLSKPVEPEKLFSTILKWLRQGANGPS